MQRFMVNARPSPGNTLGGSGGRKTAGLTADMFWPVKFLLHFLCFQAPWLRARWAVCDGGSFWYAWIGYRPDFTASRSWPFSNNRDYRCRRARTLYRCRYSCIKGSPTGPAMPWTKVPVDLLISVSGWVALKAW